MTQSRGFRPLPGLGNRHVQSILASAKWRVPFMQKRLQPLLKASIDECWSDAEGNVLHSVYAKQPSQASALIILIHGWEGSHESVYMRSTASSCFAHGYDVLCLNLRDHGPSHSFNEGLFHAQRIDETVGVLQQILRSTEYERYHLVGFSLGGNFALRAGAEMERRCDKTLNTVNAVCPVIDPKATFAAMRDGPAIYLRYFMKKWKRSLHLKIAHFPELLRAEQVDAFDSLDAMTEHLVLAHTPFESVDDYFDSYRLVPEQFADVQGAINVLWSKDDPVIPHHPDFLRFAGRNIKVELAERGGHCGFISNYWLQSYIDQWLLDKLKEQ